VGSKPIALFPNPSFEDNFFLRLRASALLQIECRAERMVGTESRPLIAWGGNRGRRTCSGCYARHALFPGLLRIHGVLDKPIKLLNFGAARRHPSRSSGTYWTSATFFVSLWTIKNASLRRCSTRGKSPWISSESRESTGRHSAVYDQTRRDRPPVLRECTIVHFCWFFFQARVIANGTGSRENLPCETSRWDLTLGVPGGNQQA